MEQATSPIIPIGSKTAFAMAVHNHSMSVCAELTSKTFAIATVFFILAVTCVKCATTKRVTEWPYGWVLYTTPCGKHRASQKMLHGRRLKKQQTINVAWHGLIADSHS